jgi:hypothetical protein
MRERRILPDILPLFGGTANPEVAPSDDDYSVGRGYLYRLPQ